jgi:hypothetical protein
MLDLIKNSADQHFASLAHLTGWDPFSTAIAVFPCASEQRLIVE